MIKYLIVLISMTGFVPKHVSVARVISFLAVIAICTYIGYYHSDNAILGVSYFAVSEILYIGFISLVLTQNGYRHWFIKRWKNEEDGYLAFEAVLGILFFLNGSSLSFLTASTHGHFSDPVVIVLVSGIAGIMFFGGFFIKIWAAKVVSIDIYYWKDMFQGKKICEFVVSGPYKFLSNPMYGVGQLPGYALALWQGSVIGLIAAFLNQLLIFTFYFAVEKKFIERVYLGKQSK